MSRGTATLTRLSMLLCLGGAVAAPAILLQRGAAESPKLLALLCLWTASPCAALAAASLGIQRAGVAAAVLFGTFVVVAAGLFALYTGYFESHSGLSTFSVGLFQWFGCALVLCLKVVFK